MKVTVNINKADRKQMAKDIAEKLGKEMEYLGVPSCAYRIGGYTVAKDCTIEIEEGGEATLVRALMSLGYEFGTDFPVEEGEPETNESETEEPELGQDGTKLTIEMPRNLFTEVQLDNLEKLIESKASLIKKAVGTDSLEIKADDEKIAFPWFNTTDPAEAKAYSDFIAKLCQTAKDAKRVTAKDREVESEKFTFRCFLLKLGFTGAEYKEDRKILLRNLSGPAAFPNEAAQRAHMAKQKAMKEVRS